MARARPARRADDRARRGRRADRRARRSTAARYAGFLASRPPAAEDAAIDLVDRQAARTGGRAHVVHLCSADGAAGAARGRGPGVDVTVETCPHYLIFDAEEVPDGATEFKCCPPIREAGNREQLWAALGRRRHRPRGLRPLAVHGRAEAARATATSAGLGRHRVAPARPARRVDRAPAPAATRWSTSCGWMASRAGRPGRAARQGRIEVGADADLVRASRPTRSSSSTSPAAPQEPGLGLRRATLTGVVRRDLAARRTRRPDGPPRAAAGERRAMTTTTCPAGGLPPQTELTTDRARLHRGVRRAPARHDERHRRQPCCRSGTTPGCGCWPGRCPASPRPSASTSSRSRPAAAATAPETDPTPRRCCSWWTGRWR